MDIRQVIRFPVVLLSFWMQTGRSSVPRKERMAHFLAWSKLHWISLMRGGRGPVTVRILGFKVTGFQAGTLRYLFAEIFIEQQYAFESATDQPLIIDCGANIGMAVLYFKRRWPRARIIAFEANPDAFALLKRNVEQNGLEDVELHNVALADAPGTLAFYVSEYAGTLTGSVRSDRGGSTRLEVPAATLSSHLQRLNTPVDAVKIDIEGAEWMVLQDLESTSTLTRAKRYLVEYHHRISNEKSRLAQFLAPFERAGFDYEMSATIRPGHTFQDLLIRFER